eukprot:g24923.t1
MFLEVWAKVLLDLFTGAAIFWSGCAWTSAVKSSFGVNPEVHHLLVLWVYSASLSLLIIRLPQRLLLTLLPEPHAPPSQRNRALAFTVGKLLSAF